MAPDTIIKAKPRRKKCLSKKPPSNDQPKEDLIMKLPAELRNRTYEEVLVDKSDKMTVIKGGKWKEPGLLSVSKAIRAEALPMYYGQNQFFVEVHFKKLNRLCENFKRFQRKRRIRGTLWILDLHKKDISSLWPLHKMGIDFPGFFRGTSPQLTIGGYRSERAHDVAKEIVESSISTGNHFGRHFSNTWLLKQQKSFNIVGWCSLLEFCKMTRYRRRARLSGWLKKEHTNRALMMKRTMITNVVVSTKAKKNLVGGV